MSIQKRAERPGNRRNAAMPYVTSEMAAIIERVGRELEDEELAGGLHFSPTALTLVRHVMMAGGTIITDTDLLLNDMDRDAASKLGVALRCFIDDPQIVAVAEQKRTTRAEVALTFALSLPGLKLIAIGSAPAALNRLLLRYQEDQMNDVVVVAAPTGFASVVALKERIWESKMPAIVMRGKKGGTAVTAAVVNALMAEAVRVRNL